MTAVAHVGEANRRLPLHRADPGNAARDVHRIPPGRAIGTFGLALLAALFLLVVAPATTPAAQHHATLLHIGPSGLEAYDAWTRDSTTLVPGMTGSWWCPILSPDGLSVVTLKSGRSDRARATSIYGATFAAGQARELTFPDSSGFISTSGLVGWLDDYTVVFSQLGGDESIEGRPIARDIRTGEWRYYDYDVPYPSTGRKKTAGDKAYATTINRTHVMTIRVRATKKLVARFKVPGSGNGATDTSWHVIDWSISPDRKFVAYELWRADIPGANYGHWRTYVCTIKGKEAKRLQNDDGGFLWR